VETLLGIDYRNPSSQNDAPLSAPRSDFQILWLLIIKRELAVQEHRIAASEACFQMLRKFNVSEMKSFISACRFARAEDFAKKISYT